MVVDVVLERKGIPQEDMLDKANQKVCGHPGIYNPERQEMFKHHQGTITGNVSVQGVNIHSNHFAHIEEEMVCGLNE